MKKLLIGTVLSFALTACGMPTNSNLTTQSANNESAQVNALNSDSDFELAGFGGGGFAGGKAGFKGFGGKMGEPTAALNLTDDQKAKFKALKDAQKAEFEKNKPTVKPDFQKMKDAHKALLDAFKADGLTKDKLKSLLDGAKPPAPNGSFEDAHLDQMIKTYNIFTPEQRQKMEDAKKAMADKMATKVKDPAKLDQMKANQAKKFDEFATKLALNDAQKAALKALEPSEAEMQEMKTKRDATEASIQAELKSGNATVASLKAIMTKDKADMEAKRDARLDKVVALHALLNADQRAKLANKVLNFGGHGGKGHAKGHGGHGGPKGGFDGGKKGFGGQGGPKGFFGK